jgi:adenine-specific DNA-methyltransferase
MKKPYQRLPGTGPERERLRAKGQFWTPDWVAEAMVGYVLAGGSDTIFDPAVGAGAFFRAAKKIAAEMGQHIKLLGTEIDPDIVVHAQQYGLHPDDVARVQITDFVHQPPARKYQAIVANPPYIRHHRLSVQEKTSLRQFALSVIGHSLDGRAGLHNYFFIRALRLLEPGGRLAFLMPADTCEGIFASRLWNWIVQHYHLRAVVTFTPQASPFPEVDTNPLIFLIQNQERMSEDFFWVRCSVPETVQLKAWMLSDLRNPPGDHIDIRHRELHEGLATGFSRPPRTTSHIEYTLADFARVVRGIATGSNEFFFLTTRQASELMIPDEFLRPAIGRTRDVPGHHITLETLKSLDKQGRPTVLFCPDSRSMEQFPVPVQHYLRKGMLRGLPQKPLISTRHPWYKMETRAVPPFLFAYLGRRRARFIRNDAGVVPLTVFLCVYPLQEDQAFLDTLWTVLCHPETVANLSLVGKSYGGGAIKVEPRALERLPLPASMVKSLF